MGSFERAFWYILAEATPKSEVRNLGEARAECRTPYTLVMFPERKLIKCYVNQLSEKRSVAECSQAEA